MSQQGLRQASVRAVSGTTLSYEGDWHAMWTGQGIAAGTFNERMMAYATLKTGTTYTNVNNAMQALAAAAGATNFGSMGTFTASTSQALLDGMAGTAARAYSTRKLKSAYAGSAIRIRRSSDNAEQDIGFSGEGLDTAAITTFVGANSAYLAKWYDQSGNADNMVQVTAASQIRIVNAGVLDVKNTKPIVFCNATGDANKWMTAAVSLTVKEAAAIGATSDAAAFGVYPALFDGSANIILIGDNALTSFYVAGIFGAQISVDNGANTAKFNGTLFQVRGNSATGGASVLQCAKEGVFEGARHWVGWVGEMIAWTSELSAGDRTTLYTNQKAYWGTA